MPSPKNLPSNILSLILSLGYFPKQLPSVFQTTSFSSAVLKSNNNPFRKDYSSQRPLTHLLKYDVPSKGAKRRILSIPNPIWFNVLSEHIVEGWAEISQCLNRGGISISRPTVDERKLPDNQKGRAFIREFTYDRREIKRLELYARSRYILRTDLARFYPSIYTHSLGWAIHGKDKAKNNKRNSNLLGNKLDKSIQNSQEGQTLGLPIGPDTSFVLAELLLSPIDSIIEEFGWYGFRHVDDMEFGFKTKPEAEKALSQLRRLLKDNVELSLNEDKTSILDLPTAINELWVYTLRNFELEKVTNFSSKLIEYFDLTFNLYRQTPNQGILSFAIKRLLKKDFLSQLTPYEWNLIQLFLFQCLHIDTTVTINVISVLDSGQKNGLIINHEMLEIALNDRIIHLCQIGHVDELIWTLWALIYWKQKLSLEALNRLYQHTNSFVVLLVLQAQEFGLINEKIDMINWKQFGAKEELEKSEWLLAYETLQHGWYLDLRNKKYNQENEYFHYLANNEVKFFDASNFKSVPIIISDDFYHQYSEDNADNNVTAENGNKINKRDVPVNPADIPF